MKLYAIAIGLVLLAGLGCSPSATTTSVTRAGSALTNSTTGSTVSVNSSITNCNGHVCGTIVGANQSAFQQALNQFLGTDSTTLGTVSANANDSSGTGVRFYGALATSTAVDCTGGSGATTALDLTAANFNLIIYDSFSVSQTTVNGQVATPILITYTGAVDGSIQGTQVSATFADNYGYVYVTGTISGQTLTGFVNFDNYDGNGGMTSGPQNVLQFTIATSAILNCQ
jgi:hypothetical protein